MNGNFPIIIYEGFQIEIDYNEYDREYQGCISLGSDPSFKFWDYSSFSSVFEEAIQKAMSKCHKIIEELGHPITYASDDSWLPDISNDWF